MALPERIDQDPEGIAQGAVRSGDVMQSTQRVQTAVDNRIKALRWEGSAGDALRDNGEQIKLELERAVVILRNKQDALQFTHNATVTANADGTSLFRSVNPEASRA